MQNTVSILGTEYTIEFKSDEEVAKDMNAQTGEFGGYCNAYSHKIVIADLDKCEDTLEEKKALKGQNMCHEVTHAFLNESGLRANSNSTDCWAGNEEMVDWFAIQSPKIYKVFEELDLL